MRTFKSMNKSSDAKCPICLTQNDGDVVLIGIVGTQDDGLIEAKQFHLDCIELIYDEENNLIYQVLDKKL